MTNLYSMDIRIVGTAYVKAESPEEAEEKLRELHLAGIEVGGDPLISGLKYNDPDLPEISLSPAMTLFRPMGTASLKERNVPFNKQENKP